MYNIICNAFNCNSIIFYIYNLEPVPDKIANILPINHWGGGGLKPVSVLRYHCKITLYFFQ